MQERGRRRFDAILDAAAAILIEHGMAGFTVHGVVARANTSIGSMGPGRAKPLERGPIGSYQAVAFFPDGESVLRALGERHVAALSELLQNIRDTDDVTWSSAPLGEAVGAVLNPILGYMEEHPDLLALAHSQPRENGGGPEEHELDAMSIEIFERFIAARTPDVTQPERQLRARMVHSMTEGVAMRAAHYSPAERSPLLGELRGAVTAYLAVYERALSL